MAAVAPTISAYPAPRYAVPVSPLSPFQAPLLVSPPVGLLPPSVAPVWSRPVQSLYAQPSFAMPGFDAQVPAPTWTPHQPVPSFPQLAAFTQSWSPSPEIQQALVLLGQIQHLPPDEAYMRQLGVNITFRSGMDALNLIQNNRIRVEFGDMGDTKAHAQWIKDQNLIMINQKYRGDLSRDSLYAISEAIYHEAGHAALMGDDQSSIQEEVDCLALNTLANRFHAYTDPSYARSASTSPLIADGVALYSRLFFDQDPYKTALVRRVIDKYGMLPPSSPDHPVPLVPWNVPLADRITRQIHTNHTLEWTA